MASIGLRDELAEAFQAEHPNFLFGTFVKLAGPTRGLRARFYRSVVLEPGDVDPGRADIAINLPYKLRIRSGCHSSDSEKKSESILYVRKTRASFTPSPQSTINEASSRPPMSLNRSP